MDIIIYEYRGSMTKHSCGILCQTLQVACQRHLSICCPAKLEQADMANYGHIQGEKAFFRLQVCLSVFVASYLNIKSLSIQYDSSLGLHSL